MKDKFLLLKILTVSLILMFLSGCTPKDTTPPSVSITSPPNNATVSGPVDIIASATDDVEYQKLSSILMELMWERLRKRPTNTPGIQILFNTTLLILYKRKLTT